MTIIKVNKKKEDEDEEEDKEDLTAIVNLETTTEIDKNWKKRCC